MLDLAQIKTPKKFNCKNVRIASYEAFGWDRLFTVPTFDFFFKLILPKPNKERIILKRDNLGRIVASKTPVTVV